jgi:hypothetical protein
MGATKAKLRVLVFSTPTCLFCNKTKLFSGKGNQIPHQQPSQDLFACQIGYPAIGGEDRFIKALVSKIQPGGTGIVEVGQSAFLPSPRGNPTGVEVRLQPLRPLLGQFLKFLVGIDLLAASIREDACRKDLVGVDQDRQGNGGRQ